MSKMAIFNRKGKKADRSDDGASSGAEKKPFTARKPASAWLRAEEEDVWRTHC